MGGPVADKPSADILALVKKVNGCKDDPDGLNAKKQIVLTYVGTKKVDLIDTLCWLSLQGAILVDPDGLIRAANWRKAGVVADFVRTETAHPGMFVSSTLASIDAKEMATVVAEYLRKNTHVDKIDVLRYINWRGFMQAAPDVLIEIEVTNWVKPLPDGVAAPLRWTKVWDGDFPEGQPTYINVRDPRGRKASLAFLGAIDDNTPSLASPAQLFHDVWKLPRPAMLITTDAGSMHPRQFDSVSRMANLPQLREWVSGVNDADESTFQSKSPQKQPPGFTAVKAVDMLELSRRTIAQWQEALPEHDTDAKEGSVNNLIFEKVKAVFSALLDAATLAGSWIIVDRTAGQGSATAEILLEQALERGAQRPTIVAIDSLERLGNARDGRNSHSIIKQLSKHFSDEECATQNPLGIEKEVVLEFGSDLKMFNWAATFGGYDDKRLPFEVLREHKRIAPGEPHDGTCDPNRKWRYFYIDGLFASASHYVIKSNDRDDFPIGSLGANGMCYLYAHGDTRTYMRLRENIQMGRPIVMLHNSGSVVTAFSWLQRVMAHTRPPPEVSQLRAPLKYLISNLSKANWVHDFGAPEVIMMRGLAERAPKLFRKQIVSVDIMSNNEEETLEVITGCFASTDGVPELGLGNAEVNVIYNTWNLHMTLCENAHKFNRLSVLAQSFQWVLAIVTTTIAISHISLDAGVLDTYIGKEIVKPNPNMKKEIQEFIQYAVLILPIVSALITAITSKLLWRDKWSVCLMAASQLACEIYKFRMKIDEYDPIGLQPKAAEGEEKPPPLTPKELARVTRQLFVERVQAMYRACLTSLSEGASLKRKMRKVGVAERHNYRSNLESRPTLAQWVKIKLHCETFFYRSKWVLPVGAFLNWLAGLRPYLQQKTLKEELRMVVEGLVSDKKIELVGKPLSDADTRLVRQGLAKKLGLTKRQLDPQTDEIRKIQRMVVVELFKEQEELKRLAAVAAGTEVSGKMSEDEVVFYDEMVAMNTQIMELQGLVGPAKLTPAQVAEEKKKRKQGGASKEVEDDYLVGPLSIESYVIFRMRPIVDDLERQALKLAKQLVRCEVSTYLINALGAVLAAVNWTEWTSLTVALVAVVAGIIEFTQLRNQLVQTNLSLRDLQTLLVRWDSLSIVMRRTPLIKAMMVHTTEESLLKIVDAHTTAASNTQTSVQQELATNAAEDDALGQ